MSSPMSDLEPIVARPAVRIARTIEPEQAEAVVRFAPLAPIASFLGGPIFTRTRDIVAANMTELLDRSEDPSRMIRMIIVEMEETLVEVRATAARSIADIKEMRRACQRLDDLQHDWVEKAGLALEKGREGETYNVGSGVEASIAGTKPVAAVTTRRVRRSPRRSRAPRRRGAGRRRRSSRRRTTWCPT